ncbi:MAG: hypothetical protein ACK4SI_01145 [Brevundimonas aurantiaca]|jgi:hypothetical protein|uniref:hypothetical protein n=1 Tax=Brevundimonas TaxID=41275 RepID=UPI0006D159FC|nr:hypothetical protein [Brevundimonas sp. DS20]ALJ09685.1 hypothetical protein JL11_16095 [Brevundimonas sp. DS20]MBB1177762.1 hypothetical protein [Pseudomonas sp. FW305-3-2-15-E-TSA4]
MSQTPQTPQALRVRRAPAQPLSVGYDRLSVIGVGREQTSSPDKPGRRFGEFDQNRTTRGPFGPD